MTREDFDSIVQLVRLLVLYEEPCLSEADYRRRAGYAKELTLLRLRLCREEGK